MIENNVENFISEILENENQIKMLLECWSNSPLLPFKITFAYPDDSKSHWHKTSTLKVDIQNLEKKYHKILSKLSSFGDTRSSNDMSLIYLKQAYKEFLDNKYLFYQAIAERKIYLGRMGNILNSYYKENSSLLAIASFDIRTKEITVNAIRTENKDLWSTDIDSSIITLPDSQFFCYAPKNRHKHFIMDSSYHKRYITYNWSGYHEGLVYFEKNVFVFGGYEKFGASKSAKKYNLNTNKWDTLLSLPIPAASWACIVYKQNILLSAHKDTKLYQFDTKINNYSLIFKGLGVGSKVLFIFDSKVYVIEGLGGIYESEKENQCKFTFVKRHIYKCNEAGQNFGIIRGDCAYYSMWTKNYGINYYSFNMKTKEIAFIKEFSWYRYFP